MATNKALTDITFKSVAAEGGITSGGTLTSSGLRVESIQTINMADAQVALITSGTAGAGQVLVTGEALVLDAQSGGTEDLLLPANPATGLTFLLANVGEETINVKASDDTTAVQTLAAGRTCKVIYTGSAWGSFLFAAS